jgi:PAS domain S-box-containing protein
MDEESLNNLLNSGEWKLLHSLPQLVYLYHLPNQESIFANRYIEPMLGYSWPELEPAFAQVFSNFVHPADLGYVREKRKAIDSLSPGEYAEFTFRIRHKDGSYRYVSTRETPLTRNDAGESIILLGIATDTTEQRLTEQASQAYETGFNRVLEKALVGICITDDRGYFTYANPIYLNLYGYRLEEVIGKHFTLVAPSSDRYALWQEIHDAFIRGEEEMAGEWIVRSKNGKLKIISTDAILHTDKDGRRQKITFVQDITDLRNAERALQDSRSVNRAITDQSLIGVAFIDAQNYRFTEVNAYFSELLGYSPDELTKLQLTDITRLHRASFDAQLAQLLQTKQPFRLETQQRRKDGKLVSVLMELILVSTSNRPLVCIITKDVRDLSQPTE